MMSAEIISLRAMRYAVATARSEGLPIAAVLRRMIDAGIEGDIARSLLVRPRLIEAAGKVSLDKAA
jgi:hypothetical protein